MAKEAVFKYDLGDLVRDKITTYEGVIIARTDWLNQCKTYTIKAQKLGTDGKPIESHGVDEPNIILVKSGVIQDKPVKENGGDRPAMERAAHPLK